MPIYRPRVAALLRVPLMGTPQEKATQATNDQLVEFPIRVRRAWWESNDHQHADVLKLTAEWRDAGTDPRFLNSAVVEFYLGTADDFDRWTPGPSNLRFIGILQRAQRVAKEGEGFVVDLEFQDYTSFFLRTKLPPEGVPDYSQNLADAWRRICDHTGYLDPNDMTKVVSVVSQLRNNLVLAGNLATQSPPDLGRSAAPRFARLGAKVPVKPGSDPWGVWQQCVGMCGLISYIRQDKCIVTEAQDYYSEKNPPRLIWGRNILSMSEARNADLAGKGVAITSYDPIGQTTLEAYYPPRGTMPAKKKRATDAGAVDAEHYEFFPYTGVTDQATLDGLAHRTWEERSRQEMEGTISTAEMFVDTVSKTSFDILSLGAGDAIRVEFEQADREALSKIPTVDRRVSYLVGKGYSQGVAELMGKNFEQFTQLRPEYCVKRVTTDLQTDEKSGSFDVEINYCNRIQVDGGASAS